MVARRRRHRLRVCGPRARREAPLGAGGRPRHLAGVPSGRRDRGGTDLPPPRPPPAQHPLLLPVHGRRDGVPPPEARNVDAEGDARAPRPPRYARLFPGRHAAAPGVVGGLPAPRCADRGCGARDTRARRRRGRRPGPSPRRHASLCPARRRAVRDCPGDRAPQHDGAQRSAGRRVRSGWLRPRRFTERNRARLGVPPARRRDQADRALRGTRDRRSGDSRLAPDDARSPARGGHRPGRSRGPGGQLLVPAQHDRVRQSLLPDQRQLDGGHPTAHDRPGRPQRGAQPGESRAQRDGDLRSATHGARGSHEPESGGSDGVGMDAESAGAPRARVPGLARPTLAPPGRSVRAVPLLRAAVGAVRRVDGALRLLLSGAARVRDRGAARDRRRRRPRRPRLGREPLGGPRPAPLHAAGRDGPHAQAPARRARLLGHRVRRSRPRPLDLPVLDRAGARDDVQLPGVRAGTR